MCLKDIKITLKKKTVLQTYSVWPLITIEGLCIMDKESIEKTKQNKKQLKTNKTKQKQKQKKEKKTKTKTKQNTKNLLYTINQSVIVPNGTFCCFRFYGTSLP